MTLSAVPARYDENIKYLSTPLVEVANLTKTYRGRGEDITAVRAVDDVSLQITRGETLGIVGESGSGKSTTARIIAGLEKPDSGYVVFDGINVHRARKSQLKELRKRQQLVFQDPRSSLNRGRKVGDSIAQPLIVHGVGRKDRAERVADLLSVVGLDPSYSSVYPGQLSGGQAQRVAIARALALNPDLVVLDEAVSSLDVSVQAQILNLLKELQEQLNLTYVLIAHDLAIVRFMASHIVVMQSGKIVESAATNDLFERPSHSYTRALMSAIPSPDYLQYT